MLLSLWDRQMEQASLGVNVIHNPDMSIHWQCSPGRFGEECEAGDPKGRDVGSRRLLWHRHGLLLCSGPTRKSMRIYSRLPCYSCPRDIAPALQRGSLTQSDAGHGTR